MNRSLDKHQRPHNFCACDLQGSHKRKKMRERGSDLRGPCMRERVHSLNSSILEKWAFLWEWFILSCSNHSFVTNWRNCDFLCNKNSSTTYEGNGHSIQHPLGCALSPNTFTLSDIRLTIIMWSVFWQWELRVMGRNSSGHLLSYTVEAYSLYIVFFKILIATEEDTLSN